MIEFIGSEPIRDDYCFMTINGTVHIDSFKLDSGSLLLNLAWTGS